MAANEAVPKPLVPGHLLRQLMEQPRRLPPTFVDVDDVGEGWRPTPTTDKPEQAKVAK